jgi:hypothetical protein
MDMQQLTAAFKSLKAATEFGRTALGLSSFNEIAPRLSGLNRKLLDAQQALFLHNVQFSELQEQHREAAKELAEAKAARAERGRYLLHAVAPGFSFIAERRNNDTKSDRRTGAAMRLSDCTSSTASVATLRATGRSRALLVLGVSLEAAKRLGERYEQNAIVWRGIRIVPELVPLK